MEKLRQLTAKPGNGGCVILKGGILVPQEIRDAEHSGKGSQLPKPKKKRYTASGPPVLKLSLAMVKDSEEGFHARYVPCQVDFASDESNPSNFEFCTRKKILSRFLKAYHSRLSGRDLLHQHMQQPVSLLAPMNDDLFHKPTQNSSPRTVLC